MVCGYCSDKIFDEPIMIAGECFCSENCASLARDLDAEDDESYFEESELEGLYAEDE